MATPLPWHATVDELFCAQVGRSPDAIALSFGDLALTYRELDRRANRWAAELRARHIGVEDVVGVLTDRGPELVAALIGILRAGAAYLPLDPRDPPIRHRTMLATSSARLVLAGPRFIGTSTFETPAVVLDSNADAREVPPAPSTPNSLAYILFTSGSTGRPKGAMLEQGGLVNHLLAMVLALRLGSSDVILQTASQCFDLSIWQMLGALVVGGRTAVLPDDVAHQPSALLRALEAEQATVVELVPSILQALCASAERRANLRPPLAALRWLVSTGETLPPSLAARWFELYPRVPIANAYGPTECSDDVAIHVLEAPPVVGEITIPIGRPIANVEVLVLDEERRALADGEVGELYVGGAGVGRGYVGDPERTAQAFVPHARGRLYRTGDLARKLQDGILEYRGRADFQVKIRGQRVELGEIETVLASHPAVREAVVMAVPLGGGDHCLAGYVTQNHSASEEDLLAYVRERLPGYMVPQVVVQLERLPLAASGKIDRRALPRPERG